MESICVFAGSASGSKSSYSESAQLLGAELLEESFPWFMVAVVMD